jgi:hypothetical protein
MNWSCYVPAYSHNHLACLALAPCQQICLTIAHVAAWLHKMQVHVSVQYMR